MRTGIKRHTRKMPSAPEAAGALITLHHSNTTGKKVTGNDHVTNRCKHKGLNGAGSPMYQGDF